jgi:hypothetical protein
VWGFRPFTYTGVGCGVAFAGAATHRSVYQVVGSDRQSCGDAGGGPRPAAARGRRAQGSPYTRAGPGLPPSRPA